MNCYYDVYQLFEKELIHHRLYEKDNLQRGEIRDACTVSWFTRRHSLTSFEEAFSTQGNDSYSWWVAGRAR